MTISPVIVSICSFCRDYFHLAERGLFFYSARIWKAVLTINPTIGATLITVVAGAIALWWNRWEKKRQEFLELRQDIYLTAAEAFSTGLSYLSSFSAPSTTLVQASEVIALMAKSTARINVVATRQVIETSLALHQAIALRLIALVPIKADTENLAALSRNNEEVIQRSRQAVAASPPPPFASSAADRLEILRRVVELQEENRQRAVQITQIQLQMSNQWLDHLPSFGPLLSVAILAIKSELGIVIDEDWFSRRIDELFAQSEGAVRRSISQFQPGASEGTDTPENLRTFAEE